MKYLLLSIMLFGCLSMNAQEDAVWDQRGFFITISPGIWVPLGNLKKTFETSPQFKGALVAQGDKIKLEIGADFILNQGNRPFNYHSSDTSFVTGRHLDLSSLGIKISFMDKLSPVAYLEKSIGIGHTSISTDVEQLKKECINVEADAWHFGKNECDGSGKYNYPSLGSFYLSAGVGLQRVVFKKRVFAVHAEYRFAPYAWFGKVEKGFGNSSLSTSFTFRF